MPARPEVDARWQARRGDLTLARTAASLPLLVLGGLGLVLVAAGLLAGIAWPLVTIVLFGPLEGYWLWVLRTLTAGGLLLGLAACALATLSRGQGPAPRTDTPPGELRDARSGHSSIT